MAVFAASTNKQQPVVSMDTISTVSDVAASVARLSAKLSHSKQNANKAFDEMMAAPEKAARTIDISHYLTKKPMTHVARLSKGCGMANAVIMAGAMGRIRPSFTAALALR